MGPHLPIEVVHSPYLFCGNILGVSPCRAGKAVLLVLE